MRSSCCRGCRSKSTPLLPAPATTDRNVLAIILAVAGLLRLIAALVIPDQSSLLPDAEVYRALPRNFCGSWHMTSHYQMPLYPLLIAIVGPGWPQIAADVALSVISVWLVYALAQELFTIDG